jgi:hypothetical protein
MMRIIKISLVFLFLGTLAFLAWNWSEKKVPLPEAAVDTKNQFVTKINEEMELLRAMSVNTFSKRQYDITLFHIRDYFKQGLLGGNDNDNLQQKENLSKKLFYIYAPKFINQAMYVFKGNEWNIKKLDTIRREVLVLQKSAYLNSTSPVANSLKEINLILNKYDQLNYFIYNANNFHTSNYGLNDYFPDAKDIIQQVRANLSNGLFNPYVNNCSRLRTELTKIPNELFSLHVSYLQRKFNEQMGRFNEYDSQTDYSTSVYEPLKNQLNLLSNDIYGVEDNFFLYEYKKLENLLKESNRKAFNYFRDNQ